MLDGDFDAMPLSTALAAVPVMPLTAAMLVLGAAGLFAIVPEGAGPVPVDERAVSPAPTAGVKTAAGRRLDVDGTCVYYEVHGHGSPVLLLHGSMRESGPYIAELAKRHTVIAVASPRPAAAGVNHRPATPDRLAAHAFAVLRRETREPVIVFAVGDGAPTAHRLMTAHPEAVRFMVAG